MFPNRSTLLSQPSTDSPHKAIKAIQKLRGTDRETLVILASYARNPHPEVMQELVGKFITLLEKPNNKWVFAAVGAACCLSIFSEAKHFTEQNTSLPVKLLTAVAEAIERLHKGRQADIEPLRLGLLALNTSLDILLANGITQLDKNLYNKIKDLLTSIKTISNLPETLRFLSEQAQLELTTVGRQHKNDVKKSSANQVTEGSLNFLLGTVLIGAGITGFAVSIGATAVTGGILAPVIVAGAFSFFVSAGFGSERFYSSLKNFKKVYEFEKEKGRFRHQLSGLPWDKTETPAQLISQYENVCWEQLVMHLVKQVQTTLSGFETRQLVFTLSRLLELNGVQPAYRTSLIQIMKILYEGHLPSGKKGAPRTRRFILEQIQGLSTHHDLGDSLAELKATISRGISTQRPKRQKKLTDEFATYCNNRGNKNIYNAVRFEQQPTRATKIPTSLVAQMEQLCIEETSDAEANQAGLASQRLIQQVQLMGQEETVECLVLPTEPDGNCGFQAIRVCLESLNTKGNWTEAIKNINRASFIHTVRTYYVNETSSTELKLLLETMFKEDGCSTLDSWCETFANSSVYLGAGHLRVLSYLYALVFHVYCVSEETPCFQPEPLSERIVGITDVASHESLTPIHLAHIVAGLRQENTHQNHFEGLVIKPSEKQKLQFQPALESALFEKANEELTPFIQGLAPLHPRAVSHAERYSGSTDDGFYNLVNGPHGFIDKTEFLPAVIARKGIKAILKARRWGKSTLFSMGKVFYSVLYKEMSDTLFSDLNVARYYPHFYQYHRGRYPVLLLDMKDIVSFDFPGVVKEFRVKIVNRAYEEYCSVLMESQQLTNEEKTLVKQYSNPLAELDKTDSINAIYKLTQWLYRHYGEKVIVFVDEYDAPLIKALQSDKPYYQNLKEFISTLFSTTFKSNESLKTTMFTGIMNAKGAGIFSDLNNVTTYTYLDDHHFGPYFGFTAEEIEAYLTLNNLYSEDLMGRIQTYFNGYVCLKRYPEPGDYGLDVAGFLTNTYSVEQCVANQGHVKSYWIESSSSHQLLVDVIRRANSVEIENQILELTGEYLHHVLCAKKPMIDRNTRRGLYLYLEEEPQRLSAWVVHNDYLWENVNLSDVLNRRDFEFPEAGEKIVQLEESIIHTIISQCVHKETREGFMVSTPLTLTNLDFLVKDHVNTAEDIYCLLFYSGYLTFTGRAEIMEDGQTRYELKIPNQEISLMFKHSIVPKIKQLQLERREQSFSSVYRIEHSGRSIYSFHLPQQEALGNNLIFIQQDQDDEGKYYVDMKAMYDELSVEQTLSIMKILEGNKGLHATRCDKIKTLNMDNRETIFDMNKNQYSIYQRIYFTTEKAAKNLMAIIEEAIKSFTEKSESSEDLKSFVAH